ncbi:MAG: hypothetical protein ACJAVV_003047 [Alphaproteobacteria bacterium]
MRRLRIESSVSRPKEGFALRTLLRHNLVELEAAMESTCARMNLNHGSAFYHLHNLQVDVNISDAALLSKSTLLEAVQTQLFKVLQHEMNEFGAATQPPTKDSRSEDPLGILLHFLRYGALPWHFLPNASARSHLGKAQALLVTHHSLIEQINQQVISFSSRQRWVTFLMGLDDSSQNIFKGILNKEVIRSAEDEPQLCANILASSLDTKNKIEMFALFTSVNISHVPTDIIEQLHNRLMAEVASTSLKKAPAMSNTLSILLAALSNIAKLDETSAKQSKNSIGKQSNEQYLPEHILASDTVDNKALASNDILLRINNAGLVLFHPYLARLFTRQQWLNSDRKLKPDCAQIAAKALCYLCAGEAFLPEHQIAIIKVLLGKNVEDFLLVDKSPLSNELTNELEGLTQSLISHWRAIGNTSSHAFRRTFIQRQGVLKFVDNTWQMTIERNAPDILLESLPFRLSFIKLPWILAPIHLTW